MREIVINSKKHGDKVCLVDDEDYDWIVNTGSIHINQAGYAVIYIKGSFPYKRERVARLIYSRYHSLCAYVDHINGNRLDNRKENLRECSFKENLRNRVKCGQNLTSTYKGVALREGIWVSRIEVDGKQRSLGSFENERDAAIAYDIAAKKYFNEFARLNFPNLSTLERERVAKMTQLNGRIKKRGSSSRFKGVTVVKPDRFRASIWINKKCVRLGSFDNEIDAAKAYNDKATEVFGENARLNLLP